jgi:hypothetical protein
MSDFQKRMYDNSEAVYARIVDPNEPPFNVEAALMDAHLQASTEDDD